MKKVFLEDLPRWRFGKSKINGEIDWKNSKGQKVKGKYNDLDFEVEIMDYKEGHLYVKYLNNPIFKIATSNFANCDLGKLLGTITKEFKYEIGTQLKDVKRDIILTDRTYKNGKKWYKYTCNVCGWTEGWIDEYSLKNIICSCCSRHTLVEGINDIPTEAPWMIPYFQGGYDEAKLYTKGSHKKIIPICPICGRIKDKFMQIKTIDITNSIGCVCGDGVSYPNKFMINMLEQLEVDFKQEYSPKWIGRKAYDFYVSSMNLIIEMDGAWHDKDNTISGQTVEESKSIDGEKDRLAMEHNIEVIRIDCGKSNLEFIVRYLL